MCASITPNTSYPASETSEVTGMDLHRPEALQGNPYNMWSSSLLASAHDNSYVALQTRLLRYLLKIPGHEERKGFFSQKQLDDLITEDSVAAELQVCFEDLDATTIKGYAARICGTVQQNNSEKRSFKKIFAILVLCERPRSIPKFLEEGISDSDLPLQKLTSTTNPPNIFNLVRKDQHKELMCFCGWSDTAVWRFEEWQWTTIAPFFHRGSRKDVEHRPFEDQIALPFTKDSRFPINTSQYQRLQFDGGFSNVFKVGIHPEHHDFCKPNRSDTMHDQLTNADMLAVLPQSSEQDFAVKSLLSRNQDEFLQEVNTLKKFSGDAHKHLVSLLATYEQFGQFYLIFPWAESDLQGFWKKNRDSSSDRETVIWMAEQCQGIADGLYQIHRYETSYEVTKRRTDSMNTLSRSNPMGAHRQEEPLLRQQLFGRHGDIKPENILFFRDKTKTSDRGVLKISDFGLAEFSVRHSEIYKRNSQVPQSTSYRPPESDLKGAFIGPSYDIWTLGCLYLEIITWQLGGSSLLERFRQIRRMYDPMRLTETDTFFEIVHIPRGESKNVGAMVKPAVSDVST